MNVLFSDDAVRASSPVTDGGTGGGGGGGGGSNPTPKPSDPDPDPDPGEGASERIDRFIRIARSKLGCRYVRGGKKGRTCLTAPVLYTGASTRQAFRRAT